MGSRRRATQPFQLDMNWTHGPRTPDWDSLWRHLFKNVLSNAPSEENIDGDGLQEELIIDGDEG
jgi:hypothetical protein